MKEIKIGYYCKYKDPKDNTVRTGLVISFDNDMAIVWKDNHPYPINRIQVIQGCESKIEMFYVDVNPIVNPNGVKPRGQEPLKK